MSMFGGLPNFADMGKQIAEFQALFSKAVEELQKIRETQQEILARLDALEKEGK